VQKEADSER